jgi:ATP-binding cassette subfamily B multidrug efflux pump
MFRFFENLVDPFQPYQDFETQPKTLPAFLHQYLKPFYGVFVWAGLFSIIAALVELVLIWAMGWIVDIMQDASPDQMFAEYGYVFIGLFIFIMFIRPIFFSVNVLFLMNTFIPNIATLVRWRAHRYVIRQSVGWFENDFAGRISNRIMQTPSAVGDGVFGAFDAVSYATAYVLGAYFVLQEADAILMLPLTLWLIGYILLTVWTIKRIGPASKAASNARSELNGHIVDTYTNIHSVKMFATQDTELDFAKDAMVQAREKFKTEMRIITKMDFALVGLNGFLIVAVVGLAIMLWAQGETSAGMVAAASALVLRLNAMTGWIMWAVTGLFREIGVVREGMETIAQPIALVDAPDAKPLQITDTTIEFRNVSHHYGRDSGGVNGLSLTIKAGEKVGLVGRSGAGKSTLVKLLLRFYDAEHGQILIDGQDITRVTQNSLRSQIGMVQQDNSLLHRSIRENIGYGRAHASEADIQQAAERAHAMEFIADLVDKDGNVGWDAKVGERGVKLSGGQRQRISLARVMLKDAPILLLDEATSALDSEVEAAILDTLYDMMQGKTVIAIAHRLSTIAQMDRIVVMDQGKIIEDGPHDVLLAQGGVYAQLWSRQSGGFLASKDTE